VSAAFGIQHAKLMSHIVISGLSGYKFFFPYNPTNGTIFEKKKRVIEHCVSVFSTTFVQNISHSKKK
jgi:hypothetical protein